MKVRRLVVLGASALLVLGGAACGAGDDEPAAFRPSPPVVGKGLPAESGHPAKATIDRLQRTFLAEDYALFCTFITKAAALQAGLAAHGQATTCERDMRRLFHLIRDGDGWRAAGAPSVTDVATSGSNATATVALDRRWQARVPLTREAGQWKLSGIFGTTSAPQPDPGRAFRAADFPPPGGTQVTVRDADGKPCPPLAEVGARNPGGCQVPVSSRLTPLAIMTPFGYFKFDKCSFDYRLSVDESGRTLADKLDVIGREGSACGDVGTCYAPSTRLELPWRGRVYSEGDGFVHKIDMCMNTCVGVFVGELKLRLVRDDDGWRADPVDGGGDTGLRFEGSLRVGGDLDLEAAAT